MQKIPYKTNQDHPQIRAYKEAVEKGKKSQHVLPRGDEWMVKRAGSQRASQIFDTQQEATTYAVSVAQNQGTAVFIHGMDGRIRDKKVYGEIG